MRVIIVKVICVLNAEQAVPECSICQTAVGKVQYLAQCSEEDETKVLNLLIFFSAFCALLIPLSK